jgi:shikimate dehydrogenase
VKAAVLGSPVAHSLSPALHSAGYAALGLDDWTYARIETREDELLDRVAGLDEEWRGLSLTMPLKEVAFEVAADVGEVARRAGAINTLVRRDDLAWHATNTDVAGIVGALGQRQVESALILGAGATARSALLALEELGVSVVRVAARRPEAVEAFREWARGTTRRVRVEGRVLQDWALLPEPLVVSTLPPEPSPVLGELLSQAGEAWAGSTLLDVVYAGWPTPLARAAAASGLTVVSGVDMLVHQAAEQFALFTGREAPLAAMLDVVRDLRTVPTEPEAT